MSVPLFLQELLTNSTVSTVVAATIITLLPLLLHYVIHYWNVPPGPTGVPVLGYWPFLRNDKCGQQLYKLKQKYGDVFSLTITGHLFINLGSHKAVREAQVTKAENFGDRFSDFGLLTATLGDGVGFINGEPWKVMRRFFLQEFKERGVTAVRESMSGHWYESVASAVEDLRAMNGEPVNITKFMLPKCNLILKQTLFGGGGVTEEEIKKINEIYAVVLAIMGPINMLLMGWVPKYLIFPLMPGYRESMSNHRELEKIIYGIIDKHKATYDENNIRNIIDSYIRERNDRKSKGDASAHYFTDKALMSSLMQFLGDGVSAVGGFVAYFFKHVAGKPEEQEKIYDELERVVGHSRLPVMEDKSRLPYTNAYILEVTRTNDFFAVFPSQQCTKETTVGGYRIPKGAITLVNSWSANHDPNVYESPLEFDPGRFLSEDGKKRADLPIGFGIGKRGCIGESFTMNQIFLFLTAVIQNFKLEIPASSSKSNYDLFMAGEFCIRAHPRTPLND